MIIGFILLLNAITVLIVASVSVWSGRRVFWFAGVAAVVSLAVSFFQFLTGEPARIAAIAVLVTDVLLFSALWRANRP